MQSRGEILIYKAKDGSQEMEVILDNETVWLNQYQLSKLFSTDRTSVQKHIGNIFKTKELDEKQTCAKIAQVQKEGKKSVRREILHYNLDVIISLGYRINSKKGTQFRQWATQRLKEHLVNGYTINEKRLAQLEQAVKLIQLTGEAKELSATEAKGLLEIITNYTQAFILLNRFDSNELVPGELNENISYEIEYSEAVKAITTLKKQLVKKKEASALFGNERDGAFAGILNSVVQTFGGAYLYKSIEEQAAHLLYFVIKNHPFTDGNKRIGAFLFVWFLERNKHRFKKSGELKINDNALVALALLVAQSDPNDKELMISLVVNLING